MNLKEILTENRQLIIKEWVKRLHSGVGRHYHDRTLEEEPGDERDF